MELTRAKRQIDYVSDSGNKNWSTFLNKPGWDGIRIRLLYKLRKILPIRAGRSLPVDFFDGTPDNLAAGDRLLLGHADEPPRFTSDEDWILALSSVLHKAPTEFELFSRAGVFWKYENNVLTLDIIYFDNKLTNVKLANGSRNMSHHHRLPSQK